MRLGSLFAGIGGIDLGFQRAGFEIAWQVENDEYCRRVLAKHWPNVLRHDDVKTFPPEGDWQVDCIAGGFPCQPVSLAGKGLAQHDERWLWPEFARVVRAIRPRFVALENVPGLLVRGFGDVLGRLAALGYSARWGVLSACSMGFPHMRRRLFVVAHDEKIRCSWDYQSNARITGNDQWRMLKSKRTDRRDSEPRVGRVVHGIPSELDKRRIEGLGNAVVPQVAEWIARRIIEATLI
jgi:DNA (cytosine-5)-methyltransferase 1